MVELKIKPKEQGDAFLLDMMGEWSDESLEKFFRKEEISFEKKPPPIEKKPPPLEPTKNGLPSLKYMFAKKKVTSEPTYRDRVFSFAGTRNSFLENGADFDKRTSLDFSQLGYNPG